MKDNKIALVIAFLCGIALFSVFKYASAINERNAILADLNQIKGQVSALESDKQNLSQKLDKEKELQQNLISKNAKFKDYLKASKGRLEKLFVDYAQIRKKSENLDSQLIALRSQNTALTFENDNLKIKLSSVAELRKAIRDLKRGISTVSAGQIAMAAGPDNEGNHGFVVKDGRPTGSAKIKIEVIPASN
jgi:chromosome segregation ATPase